MIKLDKLCVKFSTLRPIKCGIGGRHFFSIYTSSLKIYLSSKKGITAESLYLIFKSGPNDQGQTTNGQNATKGQNEKIPYVRIIKRLG